MGYVWLINEFGGNPFPGEYEAIAAGVSLAPTSVGIALKLLLETKQLQSDFGQAIITGAFIDDIFSLIAYGVLLNIGTAEKFTFESALMMPCIGVVFLIITAILAAKAFPKFVPAVCRKFAADGTSNFSSQDNALLL